ncbi:MAG TPA: GreA/GreB family elongation factor [Flavisolibacter sp.]
MQNKKRRLLLSKEDYSIIMAYIKKGVRAITFNRRDAEELEQELKKAELVDDDQLPADVVRLNSMVTIHAKEENRLLKVKVVSPEKADIKNKWISIMSPIGTALIGFRKGEQVKWKVPAGKKTFTIVDVQNQYG